MFKGKLCWVPSKTKLIFFRGPRIQKFDEYLFPIVSIVLREDERYYHIYANYRICSVEKHRVMVWN